MSVNIGVPLGTVAEKIKVSDRDRYVSAQYYVYRVSLLSFIFKLCDVRTTTSTNEERTSIYDTRVSTGRTGEEHCRMIADFF